LSEDRGDCDGSKAVTDTHGETPVQIVNLSIMICGIDPITRKLTSVMQLDARGERRRAILRRILELQAALQQKGEASRRSNAGRRARPRAANSGFGNRH
jgi:hypothetical protein